MRAIDELHDRDTAPGSVRPLVVKFADSKKQQQGAGGIGNQSISQQQMVRSAAAVQLGFSKGQGAGGANEDVGGEFNNSYWQVLGMPGQPPSHPGYPFQVRKR